MSVKLPSIVFRVATPRHGEMWETLYLANDPRPEADYPEGTEPMWVKCREEAWTFEDYADAEAAALFSRSVQAHAQVLPHTMGPPNPDAPKTGRAFFARHHHDREAEAEASAVRVYGTRGTFASHSAPKEADDE